MTKSKLTLFLLLGVLIFLFASCGRVNTEVTATESENKSETVLQQQSDPETLPVDESESEPQTVVPEQTFLAKEAMQNAWGRYEENNDYALYGDTHTPFEDYSISEPFRVDMIVNQGVDSRGYEGPYLLQIKEQVEETRGATYYEADILYNYGRENDRETLIFGVIGTETHTAYWPLPSCGDILLARVRYIVGDDQSPEDAKTPNFGNFEVVRILEHEGKFYGVNEWSRKFFSEIDNPMTEEEIDEVIAECNLAQGSAVIPYDVLEAYIIEKVAQKNNR